MTTWLPAAGLEGRYEVSDAGTIRSLARLVRNGGGWRRTTPRELSTRPCRNGYATARVRIEDGRERVVWVHVLVLETFVGPRPPGLEACHGNGMRMDAALVNLRWDTRSSNSHDSVAHGTHPQARRARCPLAHRLADDNLDASTGRRGWRQCRSCRLARQAVRRSGGALVFEDEAHRRYARLIGYLGPVPTVREVTPCD